MEVEERRICCTLATPLSALQGYRSSHHYPSNRSFSLTSLTCCDMATLSSSQIIQKRLVENITLLWTLCEVPGESKENDTQIGQDEGRQLSLDRERQLTDSFAFISATTDDMQRVMAVSIEEDSDGKGMTVRLASNTGDLSDVTQGLSGIAQTLEQASLRSTIRIARREDVKLTRVPQKSPGSIFSKTYSVKLSRWTNLGSYPVCDPSTQRKVGRRRENLSFYTY